MCHTWSLREYDTQIVFRGQQQHDSLPLAYQSTNPSHVNRLAPQNSHLFPAKHYAEIVTRQLRGL